jgi:hypothetical protein
LKKYKLAGEDEHTFHVQHPDGSTFQIAKHAVGEQVHKRIKALEPIKMSDGGYVEPGDTNPLPDSIKSPMAAPEGPGLLESLGIGTFKSNPYGEQPAPVSEAIRQPAEAVPVQQPEAPQAAPQPQQPIAQQPMQQQPTNPMESVSGDYASAFAQKSGALNQLAGTLAQTGEQQQKVFERQAQQLQDVQKNYQSQHSALDAEHTQLMDAVVNQKVDPNRMWNSMSTGNKVLAAISVALSGLGAGMQGKPGENVALQVLQKSIDRDIEAQRMELGKKQTLLSENLRRYGNLDAATQATMLQLNGIAQAQAGAMAARSGSAQAIANAKMMQADLGIQAAGIKQNLAMYRMMRDAEGGKANPEGVINYLRMTDPAKAKEMEARYVPNVGLASVPVPEKARDEISTRKALQDNVGKLRSWAQSHSGTLDPAQISYGKALANTVQDLYRRANGQGVFKESEAHFVKGIVAEDPTAFFNKVRVDPKYKALEDSNLSELNAALKAHGLPEAKGGPEYKTVGGVKYMRGPNNEAIPVK